MKDSLGESETVNSIVEANARGLVNQEIRQVHFL
jgi:hypothetical protein